MTTNGAHVARLSRTLVHLVNLMQDLSARGVGLCGGSVARFGITRENPLGGP